MPKTIDITVKGTDELVATLTNLGPVAQEALRDALYEEGQKVLTEAKDQTPVLTGTLRASGFVNTPQQSGNDLSVTVGFGGAASAYALRQHEDLTYRHRVGNAKYLERPALAHAQDLGPNLATAIRRRWGV